MSTALPDPSRHPLLPVVAVLLAIAGALMLRAEGGDWSAPDPRSHIIQPMTDEALEFSTERAAPGGRFRRAPGLDGLPEANPDEGEDALSEIEALEAIGYLAGSMEAGSLSSVSKNDPRAWQGVNLYNSGHAAEAVLMDMEGNELHRWHRSFLDSWPDWLGPSANAGFWRRVHLLPDGSLLAIYEGFGLVKLDRDSNVIWRRPNRAHHDLQVLDNGDILILSRRAMQAREVQSKKPVLVDYVLLLDSEGREKHRISLLAAYAASPFTKHWRPRALRGADAMHTNSLHVLDGRIDAPAFKAGNVLLSMRHMNTIAILDMESERIVWSRRGPWIGQHEPVITSAGSLLMFDNGRRASTVREYDPRTFAPLWQYPPARSHLPLWSPTCSTAARLPNGNTLITESDRGHAFEVTPLGETVWEFHNPARPVDQPELVATLFEMLRVPADYVSWLDEAVEGDTAHAPGED